MKTFICTLFFFTTCVSVSYAQTNSPFSIGIHAGTLIYSGDLSPSRLGSWKTPGIVVGLSGHKNLSPVLATRLEISIGAMRGDDAAYSFPEWRKHRALAFASRVTEAMIAAEWSPLGREKKVYPYALAGVGFSSMRIVPDYTRFDAAYFAGEPEVAANIVKSFSKIPQGVTVFPVGFGAGYHLSPKFSLHAEAVHRFTRNDYIDGFSHSEDMKLKDGYTKYSIGLRYNWGHRDRNGCPTNVY